MFNKNVLNSLQTVITDQSFLNLKVVDVLNNHNLILFIRGNALIWTFRVFAKKKDFFLNYNI